MSLPSSDPLLAARSAFDNWRASNSKHSRIPPHLWHIAIALLDHYPLSVVASQLRLNSARLRRHLNSSSASLTQASQPAQNFIQISDADLNILNTTPQSINADQDRKLHSDAANLRLVIERPDGSRLSLSVPASNWTHLDSLCSSFIRYR